MYGLPSGRLTRRVCLHHGAHVPSGQQVDGTYIDTCTSCGARWVVQPSGARVLAKWAR